MKYSWPGNIRELGNTIQQAIILAGEGKVGTIHLPANVCEGISPVAPSTFKLPESGINLNQVEKEFLVQALEKAGGNKSKAADLLGISRRAIYSKMKTHGL